MVKTSGVGSYNTLNRDELKTAEFIYTVHNALCALSNSLTDSTENIPELSLLKNQDVHRNNNGLPSHHSS